MIVITGATGNVGRPLTGALAAAGAKVTAVSRRLTEGDVPEGVRVVAADLTRPAELRPALAGATALFLHDGGTSPDALRPAELLAGAAAEGVTRVVLLSSQGVRTRPDSRSHGVLMRSLEDAVRRSGLDWTILRPGGFHSNAYAWAPSIRAARTVTAPFGDVGLPTVDPRDIGEVAAAALLGDGHTRQVYELTGPALTTARGRAAAIGEALGEPVTFAEQTRERAHEEMLRFMPAWAVATTLAVIGAPTADEQRISPAVERVLGRSPRPFAAWAHDHVDAFR